MFFFYIRQDFQNRQDESSKVIFLLSFWHYFIKITHLLECIAVIKNRKGDLKQKQKQKTEKETEKGDLKTSIYLRSQQLHIQIVYFDFQLILKMTRLKPHQWSEATLNKAI